MQIKVERFGGIAPKIKPLQLADGLAQKAINMRFEREVLEPFRGLSATGISLPATTKTIYRYGNSAFMGWADGLVRAVDAAKVSDPFDYLLIADVNYPKVTRNDMATNSVPYPSTTYRLGVPQPTWPVGAPAVTRIDDSKNPDADIDVITLTAYCISFVNGFGFEGPLSDPTSLVKYYEGFDAVTIGLPMAFSGTGHYVQNAKVRIYRANATSGEYQYVNEVPLGTPIYTDVLASDELGLVSETATWFGPPDDDLTVNPAGPLRNLTAMPGGFFIGSTGDELCASVIDAPYAWPYRVSLGYIIMGIAVMGNAAVVATTGPTFVVQGVDPSALQPTRINTNQSCVSSRSVVNVGDMVIYASPDGLVGVAGYEAILLTEELLTKEEWQAFDPSNIHAYYYEGKYIFFNGTKGWVFRAGKGLKSLGELGFSATAGFSDSDNDELFLMVGGVIYSFDTNATRLEYQWESKLYRSPVALNFGYMQVAAETYPVTVSMHTKKLSGVWVKTDVTFASERPRPLPAGYTYQDFYFSATGIVAINSISVAHSLSEFDYV